MIENVTIGDWVHVNRISKKIEPHNSRVLSIRREYTGQVYIEGGYNNTIPKDGESNWFGGSVGIEYIAPISLTPEIMEKNGFKLNVDESCSLSEMCKRKILAYDFPDILGNRFLIEYDTQEKVAYLTDHSLIPIKYVHEFQQLLRLMSSKAEQVEHILNNFRV
jgi:hypothetical protein